MITLTCTRCKGDFELDADEKHRGMAQRFVRFCDPCIAGIEAESESIEREQANRLHQARIATLPMIFQRASWDDEDDRHPQAWQAARLWAHEGGVLVLLGPAGTGKSHLAAVAASAVMHNRDVTWVSVPSFLLQLTADYGSTERSAALDAIKGAKPLVLDDLDKTSGSDWAQAQLFAAIDNRITAGRPLIVTANTTREQMEKKLGTPITSRLLAADSLVCVMAGADRRSTERTDA